MDSASILVRTQERKDQQRRWDEVNSWPQWKKNGTFSHPMDMNLTKEALGKVVECLPRTNEK